MCVCSLFFHHWGNGRVRWSWTPFQLRRTSKNECNLHKTWLIFAAPSNMSLFYMLLYIWFSLLPFSKRALFEKSSRIHHQPAWRQVVPRCALIAALNPSRLGEAFSSTKATGQRFPRSPGGQWDELEIPSGKHTKSYGKIHHNNSGFSHQKWWFSIATLNYQRVWIWVDKPIGIMTRFMDFIMDFTRPGQRLHCLHFANLKMLIYSGFTH